MYLNNDERGGTVGGLQSLTINQVIESKLAARYTANNARRAGEPGVQGAPTIITYRFAEDAQDVPSPAAGDQQERLQSFSSFSSDQRSGAVAALAQWASVANVQFRQATPGEAADVTFAGYLDGTGHVDAQGVYRAPAKGVTTPVQVEGLRSVVWINNGYENGQASPPGSSLPYNPAQEAQNTVLHEIGHALGLDDVNATVPRRAYFEDTLQYTVMSYIAADASGADHGLGIATSPLLDDIAAIQDIYGANLSTALGDTSYFAVGIYSVWDAGGIDTFDFQNSSNQKIDLREGHFSDIGGYKGNVSIAIGVLIENASGGAGNDTIIGNDSANVFYLSTGQDEINGLGGYDTADLTRVGSASINVYNDSLIAIYGGGASLLESVEQIHGSNDIIRVHTVHSGTLNYLGSANGSIVDLSDTSWFVDEKTSQSVHIVWNMGAHLFEIGTPGNIFSITYGGSLQEQPDVVFGDNKIDIIGTGLGDTIDAGHGGGNVYAGDGDDTIRTPSISGNEIPIIHGGRGIDHIYLGAAGHAYGDEGTDIIYGSDQADTINGGAGDDDIHANGGNDVIEGLSGTDTVSGGDDTDTYIVAGASESVRFILGGTDIQVTDGNNFATVRADVERYSFIDTSSYTGDFSFDYVDAYSLLLARSGHAYTASELRTALASLNKLQVYGTPGRNFFNIHGGPANETFNVNEDVRLVDGGGGRDVYLIFSDNYSITIDFRSIQTDPEGRRGYWIDYEGSGRTFIADTDPSHYHVLARTSTLIFGEDMDVVESGPGGSTVYGGGGRDIIHGNAGSNPNSLYGDAGNDVISMDSASWAFGGTGEDVITGSGESDHIDGGDDNDRISAAGGNDELFGGKGTDLINGGDGHDTAIYELDAKLVFYTKNGDVTTIGVTRDNGATIEYDRLTSIENINIGGQDIDLSDTPDSTVKGKGFNDAFIDIAMKAMPSFSLSGNAFDSPPYSPLILDLDGDGVEVSNVTASTTTFDMNLDGFAERTAWVRPDDALLALDRNGNGIIDDSSELFGSNTTNGFVTLAALDSNQDGSITSADARFSELRVWSDANSNGKTDAGELTSLSDSGITSISLAAVTINEVNAGNSVTHRSTFTRGDGTTGRVDDVWFRSSLPFAHDKSTDAWTPSSAVTGMPTLVSYGKAHNLLWAMDQSPSLKGHADALVAKVMSGDMTQFRADFQGFVMEWLGVNPAFGKQGYGQHIERSHYDVLRTLHGSDVPYGGGDYLGGAASNLLELEYQHAIDTMAAKFISQVSQLSPLSNISPSAILKAFSSTIFSYKNDSLGGDLLASASAIGALVGSVGGAQAGTALHFLLSTMDDGTAKNDVRSAAEAAASGSDALELAIFKGYGQASTIINQDTQEPGLTATYANVINGTSSNDTLNADAGSDLIDPGLGDDTIAGGTGSDTVVYRRGYGNDTLTGISSYGEKDRIVFASDIRSTDVSFQLLPNGASVKIIISATDSVTLMNVVNNPVGGMTLEFGDGVKMTESDLVARFLTPTEGDDNLAGGAAAETISAGAGNDIVHGNGGNDVILGGSGNDVLYGGSGDDTITGGAGDDTLYGGDRNDTYVYNIGDGNDRIYAKYDTYADYGVDKIVMGPGITATDLTFTQSADGHDLIVTLAQGGSMTIVDGFWNAGTYYPYARIGSIVLADGTVINSKTMLDATLTGDAADNVLHAVPDDGNGSLIIGNGGNDSLYGGQFNDILVGGAGNDLLDGYLGNDSITGGAGNDNIVTGPGDDVIYYNLGDGDDTILNQGGYYNYGSYLAGADRIVFGAGIQSSDLTFTQSNGKDMLVTIAQGGSMLITKGVAAIPAIATFQFADGTTISGSAAVASTMIGKAGNQTLYDTNGNDIIQGGAGDDVIHSTQGNDTFKYDLGDGRDTIWKVGYSGQDTLLFGPNLTPTMVHFTASPDNVYDVIAVMPDGGSVTLRSEYQDGGWAGSTPSIEAFTFADGTSYTMAQVQAMMKTPTEMADVLRLSGTVNALGGDDLVLATGAVVVDGGAGNDTIYGSASVDTINGGDGNDYIVGGNGSDILNGGAGNDTIYGNGTGPDMFGYVDEIHGGEGDDYVYANLYDTNVTGDAGIDTIDLSGVSASYAWTVDLTLSSNQFKFGTTTRNYTGFEKVLLGGAADVVKAGSGTLLINAGAGNDNITGSTGATTIIGGAGFDQINGGTGSEYIDGGDDSDSIYGGGGSNTIYGGGGNDVIQAGLLSGANTGAVLAAYGGIGNDTLTDGYGSVVLDGGDGDDTFYAYQGYYNTTGFAYGTESLLGGSGNDLFYVSTAGIMVNGGVGYDRVGFYLPGYTWTISVTDNGINQTVGIAAINNTTTYYGVEGFSLASNTLGTSTLKLVATGSSIDNTFGGGQQNDELHGGGGSDTLTGYAGQDLLYGDDGNDFLTGGTGNDRLDGGNGIDTAIVDKASSAFTMTTDTDGAVILTDSDTGTTSLGTDRLYGIELLRTTSGTIGLASPIVLDLDGDGIHLGGITDGVAFDMDGDGVADQTGWFARGDAVLVRDLDGDGRITTGAELSFTHDVPGALTDLIGLSSHDEDGNHRIDQADAIWGQLRLWIDDGDGVQQANELKSLADAGVSWIGLDADGDTSEHAAGDSLVFGTAAFGRTDGTQGDLADALFAYSPTSVATAVPQEEAAAPQMPSYGAPWFVAHQDDITPQGYRIAADPGMTDADLMPEAAPWHMAHLHADMLLM